jgi:hypothetical protein
MNKRIKKNEKNEEEEISFLKLTIEHFVKENQDLKQKIEDLKITYQSDKYLLNEYFNQITNKDDDVKKLINTVELFKTRIKNLENIQVQKYLTKNNQTLKNEEFFDDGNSSSLRYKTEKNTNNSNNYSNLRFITENKVIKKNNNKDFNNNKFENYKKEQKKLLLELKFLKNKLNSIKKMIYKNLYEDNLNLYDGYLLLENINKKNNQNLENILKIDENDYNKKEEIILLKDNNNIIWELIPENNLTEEDLKKGNIIFDEEDSNNFLKETNDTEVEKFNDELNNKEDDVQISLNSSFMEELDLQYNNDDNFSDTSKT